MKNKKNKSKKNTFFISILIIILFILTSLLFLTKQNYNYIDLPFKNLMSYINTFMLDKLYHQDRIDENIVKSKIKYLEEENNNLKEIVELKKSKINYQSAEVINRNFSKVNGNVIINKGNFKLNMPVINQNGIVGFIEKSNKKNSQVKLITKVDKDSMTVLINNNISGILSFYDNKKKMFKIVDVISKEEIKENDIVTLSDYKDGIYKGILLGYVNEIKEDNYGLSKIIWVKSNVDFNNLLYVLVEEDK